MKKLRTKKGFNTSSRLPRTLSLSSLESVIGGDEIGGGKKPLAMDDGTQTKRPQ